MRNFFTSIALLLALVLAGCVSDSGERQLTKSDVEKLLQEKMPKSASLRQVVEFLAHADGDNSGKTP